MYRPLSQSKMAARVLLVLLVLGLALADLSVVAAPWPAVRLVAGAQGDLVDEGSPPCASVSCQAAVLAAPLGKRGAVRARLAGLADPGPPLTHDVLDRITPLGRLTPAPEPPAFHLFLEQRPWRPARAAGADRSVPRPPPA